MYDFISRRFPVKKFATDVVEMNRFVKNGTPEFSKRTLDKQWEFVEEELLGDNELLDSLRKEDFEGVVDGLADCFVVGSYAYYISCELQDQPDRDFSRLIEKTRSVQQSSNAAGIAPYKFNSLVMSMENGVGDRIIDLFMVCLILMIEQTNADMIYAQQEVSRSNWSKFPLINSVNPDQEVSYIESQGRYTGVHFTTVKDSKGEDRYVFWSDANKFVKPSTFSEPNLKLALPVSFRK